jgi:hypothetical protein
MSIDTDTGTGFANLSDAVAQLETFLETRSGTVVAARIEHIQGRQYFPWIAVVGTVG